MAVPSFWHPAMQYVPPPPRGVMMDSKSRSPRLNIRSTSCTSPSRALSWIIRRISSSVTLSSRIPDAQQIAYENCAFESTHMKGAAAQEKAFIGTAPNLEITSGAHIPTLLDTSSPNTKAPRNNRLPIPSGYFFIRNEKTLQAHCLQGFQMVTGAGFEPATFRL